jgi:hypothetical protein
VGGGWNLNTRLPVEIGVRENRTFFGNLHLKLILPLKEPQLQAFSLCELLNPPRS